MTTALRRIVLAVAILAVLLAGLAGLTRGPERGDLATGSADARVEPELSRLRPLQIETYEFFRQGRGEPVVAGRGLFETDFFKPPPTPPAKPKPKPPETREVAFVYRGLIAFPGQAGAAYLAVDGQVATYATGAMIVAGWTLAEFDSEQAVLIKGEERLLLPFNRRATLTVPLTPKP